MKNNFRSSLFRLFKDRTFKVTLIIGLIMAVALNLLYMLIGLGMDEVSDFCNGQKFFIESFNPGTGFGLLIPINLAIFTIGEFNNGTIRNKIIAGHRRSEIYFSILLSGIVFALILVIAYEIVSVGLGSIIGGFKIAKTVEEGTSNLFTDHKALFTAEYLWKFPLMAVCGYIFIASFTIFFSMIIKSVGGTLSITIIAIVFLSLFGGIATSAEELANVKYFNPLSGLSINFLPTLPIIGNLIFNYTAITPEIFIPGLLVPLAWSIVLTILGIAIFKKEDIK